MVDKITPTGQKVTPKATSGTGGFNFDEIEEHKPIRDTNLVLAEYQEEKSRSLFEQLKQYGLDINDETSPYCNSLYALDNAISDRLELFRRGKITKENFLQGSAAEFRTRLKAAVSKVLNDLATLTSREESKKIITRLLLDYGEPLSHLVKKTT
ncbi:MAG: hypothetical protein HYY52_06700 [Candidatus Melainabacteria bacterium]|nr:hypothetical protein [Candidatus Melainabacteria bacterium]